MKDFEYVTTWSARKRHLAEIGDRYTLCQTSRAVRSGEDYVGMYGRPLTAELIERLPLCVKCSGGRRRREAEQ